jgi:hypothetical protein
MTADRLDVRGSPGELAGRRLLQRAGGWAAGQLAGGRF